MSGTDFKRHQSNQISIKDLNQDIDISSTKWNSLFNFLLNDADVVYFEGSNSNYDDEDFENNVRHVSESVLLDHHKNYRILFRAKNIIHFTKSKPNFQDLEFLSISMFDFFKRL